MDQKQTPDRGTHPQYTEEQLAALRQVFQRRLDDLEAETQELDSATSYLEDELRPVQQHYVRLDERLSRLKQKRTEVDRSIEELKELAQREGIQL